MTELLDQPLAHDRFSSLTWAKPLKVNVLGLGKLLIDALELYRHAVWMAYMGPFMAPLERERRWAGNDPLGDDLEGRQPHW